MKDKLKGLVLGLVAGSLMTGVTAFAASGSMIEVFYNVKDIKINNVSKMPTDDSRPFVYNGTTYVPLGFISNALGQSAKWDGKSKTIYIGETGESKTLYLEKDLKHMNSQYGAGAYINAEYNSSEKVTDNVGNEHSSYLLMTLIALSIQENSWGYVEYPLNGKMKMFKAKLGVTEKYKDNGGIAKVTISADGKEIYSKEVTAGNLPEDLNLDVSNALKLQIKIQREGSDSVQVGLFDPMLTQ
ncbi:stalk domain-containing protein [Paenibacillus sp. S33]|uniref:stalk domain-containing protein n=1 Tax=Paenibacillus polymyxa TaxID=1406 RepID=UPI0004DF4C49|nr:NPCBM/NEW2 domain-containing protein [Paenibacillus polymyxa]